MEMKAAKLKKPTIHGYMATTQHKAAAETLRQPEDSPDDHLGVAESSSITTNEFLPKICSYSMAWFKTD